MNFKGFIIIFTLFLVLFVGISAVSAETNDTMDNITSEADDAIQISTNNTSLENNGEILSSEDSQNQQNQSNSSLNSTQTSPAKSNFKIAASSNFVKNGGKYYIYLKDSKGNPVANKKLTIKFKCLC